MTNFLHWRKMTWAIVLWSAYLATWMVLTRSGPVIVVLWWLAGVGLLQLIMHWGTHRAVTQTRPIRPPLRPATQHSATTGKEQRPGEDCQAASNEAARAQNEAVQDWETEGGAIAERSRANATPQAA